MRLSIYLKNIVESKQLFEVIKMKKCIYCNREIPLKYLLKEKNLDNIKCPYCTKELKVNKISKLLSISLTLLVISLIVIFPFKYNIKIVSILIWIYLSSKIFRTLIYVYE